MATDRTVDDDLPEVPSDRPSSTSTVHGKASSSDEATANYFASNEETTDVQRVSTASSYSTVRQEQPTNCLDYTCLSPVISNRLTSILRGEHGSLDCQSLSADVIEQQIASLKEMRSMLAEYHQLQLQNLHLRQDKERRTLEIQISYMEALLSPSSDDKQTIIADAQNCTSSTMSPIYYLDIAPNKRIKPKPSLSTSKMECGKYHRECAYSSSDPSGSNRMPDDVQDKLAALAKGHLTRQVFRSQLVKQLRRSIVDLRKKLSLMQDDQQLSDQELHYKLEVLHQLQSLLGDIHKIFFSMSPENRMKILQHDRKVHAEKRLKPSFSSADCSQRSSFEDVDRASKKTTVSVACQTQGPTPSRANGQQICTVSYKGNLKRQPWR